MKGGFSALALLIRELLPILVGAWKEYRRKQVREEIEEIRANPDDAWADEYGRVQSETDDKLSRVPTITPNVAEFERRRNSDAASKRPSGNPDLHKNE